jgi:hypothetical protein
MNEVKGGVLCVEAREKVSLMSYAGTRDALGLLGCSSFFSNISMFLGTIE